MNILIVRNDKLGDFITALPSCYLLKKLMPNCRITVFIAPLNESIASSCEFVDEIIVDRGQGIFALASAFRAKRFELSFTLFSNTRVALAQFFAGIPKRVAPATKIAQIFYNQRILQRRSEVKMAEFEYNIALIQSEFPSMPTAYPSPLLTTDPNHFVKFCQTLDISKPVIAFHPGFGGSSDANWTVAEYIALAKSIEHNNKHDIVFTFGPGDEEFFETFNRFKGDLKVKAYFSKSSVYDFAQLIAGFELFISTSTGTFHLASAVGTKTMTFFADSLFASSKRWKGIGDKSLQHNYMIPKDADLRNALFEQVKVDLQNLI